MAKESKFLKLYLPDRSDNYDVERDQNENFLKLDAAAEQAQKMAIDLFSDKYDKAGGVISGQVTVRSEEGKARTLAIENTGEDGTFIEFITGSGRKGWIGRGYKSSNSIEIRNDVTKKSLSLAKDGKAYYDGNELFSTKNFDPNDKENSFSKNTAFNKNFGTTEGTVLEGNKYAILESVSDAIAGGHVEGERYIQDAGTKLAGSYYIDRGNKRAYLCIRTTSTTNNSTDFFRNENVKSLGGILEKRLSVNGVTEGVVIKVNTLKLRQGRETVTFNPPFKNRCFGVFISDVSGVTPLPNHSIASYSKDGFTAINDFSSLEVDTAFYMAIGY